jgi:hypothetical protein
MYKEKLIKYVQAKNKYIKNITGINYVTEDDIDDIMSWEEEECKQIWRTLYPADELHGCPWCIKTYTKHLRLNCGACSYGNRNNKCGDDSRISSILGKAGELRIKNILVSDEIIEAYNKINNE